MRISSVYGRSLEDREDLFQEIVLAVWKSLPKFRNKSSVHTWVYRIALNVSIRWAQKGEKDSIKIKKAVQLEITNNASCGSEVEDCLERKEILGLVQGFLKKLSEPDRTLMLLYLEDFNQKDISDIVGLSENAVSVRIHRVKKRLLIYMEDRVL